MCLAAAVALVCLALGRPAQAANWQLRFDISVPYFGGEGGNATQRVTAGVRLTASDNFDGTWDAVVISSSVLSAYSYHPEFAPEHQFLANDYRYDSYPKQWTFYVMSDQDGQPVTLEWALPQAPGGSCLGISLTLTDVTAGAPVNLIQSSYQYVNAGGVPRQFQLTASQVVDTPPQAPVNLFSPRTSVSSALLFWTGSSGVAGYHIYRQDPGSTGFRRRTDAPITATRYQDAGLTPGDYSYLVTAVSPTGCESQPSNELTTHVGP
jgi:hypothetical protein